MEKFLIAILEARDLQSCEVHYINYYDVEKYFSFRDSCMFYFIPYEYKVGVYKIDEIDYLKYSSDEFKEIADDEKNKILKKYMLWSVFPSYITNEFSQISVSDMNMVDITYKKVGNKKIGMLWEIVNCNNKDDFYRYVENDSKIFEEITEECADIVYKDIYNKLKKDYVNCEIHKLFLDFFGDYEAPLINITVVCNKDIQDVLEKYSYEKYVDKRYKGIKLFKRFVSYKEEYNSYIEGILNNSGSYNNCAYQLENIDRIVSYYTSLFEYDYFKNDNICSEFLFLICNNAREKLSNKLDEFNLSEDFRFFDVEEFG